MQSLQALKKISQEHPTACLRAGALMAVLSYLDFFSTGVQRVALSTAANMCKKLPLDAADFVMEAVPLLTNLLHYHDSKVMMATLLFIIPNRKNPGEKLMDWNKCKKLHWNIILLLGAGFAIADGVKTSGLADVLSKSLAFLETAPYLAIAPLVCLVSSTMTELITSNNTTTTLVVPLLIEMAKTMKVHPLLLMVPGAIGAQFAFLLPTSTPSNIVGFTTGHIEIKDMIKTGVPLKVAGIAALSLLMPTLGAFVFETSRHVQ